MYRQGDVLLVAVDAIPRPTQWFSRANGRVVLAYGEATGNAHAIADRAAELLGWRDERYLRVTAPEGAALTHPEHDPIVVPPGEYRVVRQREYMREAPRVVAD